MASIVPDHHLISPNRPKGIAVRLRGTGTTWTQAGTTFSLSGVAATGSSILTKVVTDATDAILVIATGSTTGTLTVSDGTSSAAVTVARYPRRRWGFGLDS